MNPAHALRAATAIAFAFSALSVPRSGALAQQANIGLTWRPNTEPDLAGYRVYYGTVSGQYPYSLDVGNTTEVIVSGLEPGVRYFFVVTAYDIYGNESAPSEEVSWVAGAAVPIPNALILFEGYPNPFQDFTQFELSVPQRSKVLVDVVDILGRRVRRIQSSELPAGSNVIRWDGLMDSGEPAPSGIYLIVARAGGKIASRAVTLVRPGQRD